MPVMGGLDFLELYAKANAQKAKVLVLSNSEVPIDTQARVISLGATRYLRKSAYTPEELWKIVETTLESEKK